MLFDLQKKSEGLDKTLEFLLRKNNQWTDISESVNKMSTELAKRQMASRIMSKKRFSFEKVDESD